MEHIILVSATGEKFNANANTIVYSQVVKEMIDCDDYDDEMVECEVNMLNVSNQELRRIIDYCEYHVAGKGDKLKEVDPIEAPLKSKDISEIVPEWYANFITPLCNDDVFKLMKAANYMHVETLIELCSAYIGTKIKGKSPEEIRKTFGITADFTDEEKEAFKKEHAWIKETL